MRKWKLVCVLMITLLLCGCGGKGATSAKQAEELALTIRGEYLAMTTWGALCAIQADYGQRVYSFEAAVTAGPEEVALVFTAPEEVAGISLHLTQAGSRLELDGVALETGSLGDSVSPVNGVPLLMEAARSGFIDVCALETVEQAVLLRVDCRNPELEPGQGRSVTLWFSPESHALLRGEVAVDGYRVLTCVFSDFSRQE